MPKPTTLPVRLDRRRATTLGAQLAGQIRDLITTGTLEIGDRLPSTRGLAADLGVSRAVTEQAFDQLLAEGWLEARRGSGTYVAAAGHVAPTPTSRSAAPAAEPAFRFDTGTPWIDPRHAAGWRRAWREVAADRPPAGYPDPAGLSELREALCLHLARTRGLRCTPDEVALTNGTTDGLRHLLATLPPGPVAMEDPGYRAAANVVLDSGRDLVDVPVGDDGLRVDRLDTAVQALYVTPAHQHPLGITMSATRRLALLERAGALDAVVIEDDYDSEFRYDVAPLPALASLDRDRVVYLGTASKSVAPALRLGWLVAPVAVVREITARRDRTHDLVPWPVQRAFLAMLREGYVDRVVRSARRVYAQRSRQVMEAIGDFGTVAPSPAGMYLTLQLDQGAAERAATTARAAGFDVPLLSDYSRTAGRHGLVLGFGGCSDAQLDAVLGHLRASLAASGPARD
ncbi:Transcriptional regulator, GntR family with aminotransferase domain [metagenome]|uniref:Transcriptional regulator, GntR family with aminotransferase domain n=1 Tax=metagenome TaxID=256318 RepID=A0A2P2C865_9ZZZZ